MNSYGGQPPGSPLSAGFARNGAEVPPAAGKDLRAYKISSNGKSAGLVFIVDMTSIHNSQTDQCYLCNLSRLAVDQW